MIQEVQLRLTAQDASMAEAIKDAATKYLSIPPKHINAIQVLRRSIDARGRTVMIQLSVVVFSGNDYPEQVEPTSYPYVQDKEEVIVIGSGPAGMFAALKLIENGFCPVILERGKNVRERRRDIKSINVDHIVNPDSNYCFGEGGAGTYSDGKLYTRSKKRGSIDAILRNLVAHGATEEIITDAHPHIGTNKLPQVVENIRRTIIEHGGKYLFGERVTDIHSSGDKITGVSTSNGNKYFSRAVILATGHSARDIYDLLHSKGILMEAKGIAVGVRIEHPQELIDNIQYGGQGRGQYLPAAAYKLVEQCSGRGVYSFCMCPGGFIVPSATAPEQVVVNGMSTSSRDNKYANSGIVVSIEPQDLPQYQGYGVMAMLRFMEDVERRAWNAAGCTQTAPAARMTDFCEGRISSSLPDTSYQPGIVAADLHQVLGDFVAPRLKEGLIAFGRKMKGYYTENANLIGVETRTSSPLRIPRDPITLTHPQIAGLFPCGEGAGFAGGIISAAIDGENCALAAVNSLKHQ